MKSVRRPTRNNPVQPRQSRSVWRRIVPSLLHVAVAMALLPTAGCKLFGGMLTPGGNESTEPWPAPSHADNDELVVLFEKTLARKWENETFITAVTTSERWHVTRDPIHGQPVKRTVLARVILKHDNHDYCRNFKLTFAQSWAGTGMDFHRGMEVYVGGSSRYACEPGGDTSDKPSDNLSDTESPSERRSAHR